MSFGSDVNISLPLSTQHTCDLLDRKRMFYFAILFVPAGSPSPVPDLDLSDTPQRGPTVRSLPPSPDSAWRSSRPQTPSFSEDTISELAGSDMAREPMRPCSSGLVNVEVGL